MQLVDVNKITVDSENPNVMTKPQLLALQHAIRKFNFIIPIITNKDLVVADGEHRLEAAKKLGMKQVPVVALPISDVDRRIVRQVLNKLRGEHDKEQDIREFIRIEASQGIPVLAELLAQEEEQLRSLFEDSKLIDPNMQKASEDSYLYGSVRQIVMYFDTEQYDQTVKRLEFIMEKANLAGFSECFLHLIEQHEAENSRSNKERA